ncbi:MAG TPA: hypothetical protein VE422_02915 [Terriglobia bacterium]|nr:hypothetical protein [Terriglobia bacterium]
MKAKVGLKLRIFLVLLPLIQASCISTKRTIPVDARPLPAQTATRADLLRGLEEQSKQIRTLQGTIALDASSGGNVKTEVMTEYRQTKGFVLVERPTSVRLRIQAPLALATVFDMVSDGRQYRVSVPIKNKFLVGDVDAPAKDKNAILNLRPQVLITGLFVDITRYLNNPQMKSTLEETREGRRSFYVFSFINVAGPEAHLVEKLWIDRLNLQVSRKQVFRADGKVETYVEYSGYSTDGKIRFPQVIVIQRPIEDYALKMTFQKTTVNEKLTEDAFNLEQPSGSELVRLEAEATTGSTHY